MEDTRLKLVTQLSKYGQDVNDPSAIREAALALNISIAMAFAALGVKDPEEGVSKVRVKSKKGGGKPSKSKGRSKSKASRGGGRREKERRRSSGKRRGKKKESYEKEDEYYSESDSGDRQLVARMTESGKRKRKSRLQPASKTRGVVQKQKKGRRKRRVEHSSYSGKEGGGRRHTVGVGMGYDSYSNTSDNSSRTRTRTRSGDGSLSSTRSVGEKDKRAKRRKDWSKSARGGKSHKRQKVLVKRRSQSVKAGKRKPQKRKHTGKPVGANKVLCRDHKLVTKVRRRRRVRIMTRVRKRRLKTAPPSISTKKVAKRVPKAREEKDEAVDMDEEGEYEDEPDALVMADGTKVPSMPVHGTRGAAVVRKVIARKAFNQLVDDSFLVWKDETGQNEVDDTSLRRVAELIGGDDADVAGESESLIEEGLFTIERILKKRKRGTVKEFLVIWSDRPHGPATWIRASSITDKSIIRKYLIEEREQIQRDRAMAMSRLESHTKQLARIELLNPPVFSPAVLKKGVSTITRIQRRMDVAASKEAEAVSVLRIVDDIRALMTTSTS